MQYALIIISVVGVILLIRQLYLQRQLTLLNIQKARAISDRTEVADFINRYSSSIGYSHDTEEWMLQIAGFVESAMEARAVWIYRFNQEGKADPPGPFGLGGPPRWAETRIKRTIRNP